ADASPHQLASRRTTYFRRKKPPIEIRVVRNEHVAGQHLEQLRLELGEAWRIFHHLPRDLRESRNERRNGPLRIHETLEHFRNFSISNHNRRDFDDTVTAVV